MIQLTYEKPMKQLFEQHSDIEKNVSLDNQTQLRKWAAKVEEYALKGIDLKKIAENDPEHHIDMSLSLYNLQYLEKLNLVTEENLGIVINEIPNDKQKALDFQSLYLKDLLSQTTIRLLGRPEINEMMAHPSLDQPINADRPKKKSIESSKIRELFDVRWINFAKSNGIEFCYKYMKSNTVKKILEKFIIEPDDICFIFEHPQIEKIKNLLLDLNNIQKETSSVLLSYLKLNDTEIESLAIFINENKNNLLKFRSLYEVLIEFEQWKNPIPSHFANTFYSPQELNKVKTLQRYLRSQTRVKIHHQVFHDFPITKAPIACLSSSFPDSLSRRLTKIIDELSHHQAIINGKELNHFSVVRNIQSIFRNKYILGHKRLNTFNIKFEVNALGAEDRSDQDTICFAPGRVDFLALRNKNPKNNTAKENSCVIICDLTKTLYPGKNQFFKLLDLFCKNFEYSAQINESLSIQIHNFVAESLTIKLSLNNQDYTFDFLDKEVLYYGNFEDINRFCLTRLFSKLENNVDFCSDLVSYLEQLEEADLKKLLIIIAQSMTYYSEYNVHSYLNLEDVRIQEIRIFCHRIKYNLRTLTEEQYDQFLQHFANSEWDADILRLCETILPDEENIIPNRDFERTFIVSKDFSSVPASLFMQNEYIETRPHVNNTRDDISKKMTSYQSNQNTDFLLETDQLIDSDSLARLNRIKESKSGLRIIQLSTYLYECGLLNQAVYNKLIDKTCPIESFANLLLQLKALSALDEDNFHCVLTAGAEELGYFYHSLRSFKNNDALGYGLIKLKLIKDIILHSERSKSFCILSQSKQKECLLNFGALNKNNLLNKIELEYYPLLFNNSLYLLESEDILNEQTLDIFLNKVSPYDIYSIFSLLKNLKLNNEENLNLFLNKQPGFFEKFAYFVQFNNKEAILKGMLYLMKHCDDWSLEIFENYSESIIALQKNEILDLNSWNLINKINNETHRKECINLLISVHEKGLLDALFKLVYQAEVDVFAIKIYGNALLIIEKNNFVAAESKEEFLKNNTDYYKYKLVDRLGKNMNQELFDFIFLSKIPTLLLYNCLGKLINSYPILESFNSNFSIIKTMLTELFALELLEEGFFKSLIYHWSDLNQIYSSLYPLIINHKLNKVTYSIFEACLKNTNVEYIKFVSDLCLKDIDLMTEIYPLDKSKEGVDKVCYALLSLEENKIPIDRNLIDSFVNNSEYAVTLTSVFKELQSKKILTPDVIQHHLTYPRYAKENMKGFIDLDKAGLFNSEKIDFIRKNSSYKITSLVWALVKLNELKILDKVNRQDIRVISVIKLKDSKKICDFAFFLLQQIVDINATKEHKSYYFMDETLINRKIEAYRNKLKEICNLTQETQLNDIATNLLSETQLTHTCNKFGLSFFESPSTHELKKFVEAFLEDNQETKVKSFDLGGLTAM